MRVVLLPRFYIKFSFYCLTGRGGVAGVGGAGDENKKRVSLCISLLYHLLIVESLTIIIKNM